MEEGEKHLTKKEKRMLAKQQRLEKQNLQKKGGVIKKFIWWGVGALLIVLAFWYMKGAAQAPTTSLAIATPDKLVEHDHTTGATESAKLLIEYSDLECPACAANYALVKQLLKEHGDDVTFAYRHFPLQQHKNARPAAYAAESAGKQGKYWEMEDLLFTRQKDWTGKGNADEIFAGYAQELGLNIDQFKADRDLQEVKDKVNADSTSGSQARVNSTPTFFLNGQKLEPAASYEDFLSKLGL